MGQSSQNTIIVSENLTRFFFLGSSANFFLSKPFKGFLTTSTEESSSSVDEVSLEEGPASLSSNPDPA